MPNIEQLRTRPIAMHPCLTRSLLLVPASLLLPAMMMAQALTTQNTLTPQELVETILAGQGVTVSNVTFNGQPGTVVNPQIGSFNGTTSNLGLDQGIVLATGSIQVVEGPNMTPSSSAPVPTPNSQADPDLGHFMSTQRDVAVLEFDFIPTGDTLSFRFIFGSEEYPEFVCSQYNDAFGFFLSGPGISGPFSNQGINLAVIPGTNVPVAINTVNPGTPGVSGNASTCAASDPNWQSNSIYYVDNDVDLMNPWNSTVELDGFTVPITAGLRVQCGETYHIKIAIADATDPNLDSAVFIEGGSFTSASALLVSVATPLNDGILTEGCEPGTVTIQRLSTVGDALINLAYSGNGVVPADLGGALAQVTIPDGSNQVSFPISALEDGSAEGLEQLLITASTTSNCSVEAEGSASVTLADYTPMEILAEDIWLHCDQDSVLLGALVEGGLGTVALTWVDHGPNPIYVTGMETGNYTVSATDQCPKTVQAVVHVDSGCSIWIPNVITPNGDGHNDAWVINGLTKSGSSVEVYNRWGNVVYETGNYGNNWKATGLPDGTYFYVVTDARTRERLTGYLTVLTNGRK